MQNKDLRDYAKERNVKLWQIADAIGVLDCNFSRMLRKELGTEEKVALKKVVDSIVACKGDNDGN